MYRSFSSRSISEISGKTKLMISFIDSDILFKDRNQIDFEDGGFFKNTDRIIYGKGGTMTYYYPWRSNKINNNSLKSSQRSLKLWPKDYP